MMCNIRRIFPAMTLFLAVGFAYGNGAEQEARAFRAAEARFMALREDLGLDVRNTFRATRSFTCNQGVTHTRLDQYFQGVRVWHGEAIDHAIEGESRQALPITNDTFAGIDVSVEPSLSEKEILGITSQARPSEAAYTCEPRVELMIYPEQEQFIRPGAGDQYSANACDVEYKVNHYRLVYHVHTERGLDHWDFLVDAHSGAIVDQWASLYAATEKAKGKSLYSGLVEFDNVNSGKQYQMKDPTRGKGHNFGCLAITDGKSQQSENPGTIYTNSSNTWGDGKQYSGESTSSVNGQTAAVDVMYGLQAAYDMYKNVLKWDGTDSKNKATYAKVHFGSKLDNAFANPSTGAMVFGDGGRVFKNLVSVDVVSHEYNHIINFTCANWPIKGEGGGLGEGNCDIGGAMVEFYVRGGGWKAQSDQIPDQGGDWGCGFEVMKSGKALRYLDKPSKDGHNDDAYSPAMCNKSDEHYIAGPTSRFFYFLSQGATTTGDASAPKYLPKGMKGLGNTRAYKIWFKAMSAYTTSGVNHAKAREASIRAAKELFGPGSAEEAAVHNAWGGVNVGKVWPGESPDPGTPNSNPTPHPKPPSNPKPGAVSIATQPMDQTVAIGDTATFTVKVSGGKAPFSYTWYWNSVPIPDYSDPSYCFDVSEQDRDAKIHVVVKDANGASAKSREATLTLR